MRLRGYIALLAAALGACGGVTGALLVTPLPARGLDLISEQQELEAGRQAARQVEQKYHVVTGTPAARLVEQLGRRMAAVSGRPSLPWQFRVLQEKTINAFSVPGYVYVHTGLLDAVGNDTSALAGVIGHEVGHTAAHHAKKQMEKGAVAGLIGSVLSGGDQRRAGWINMAGNLVLLKFSRNDEYEADRLGLRYMLKTGYDPNGLIRFFTKLQKQEAQGSKMTTLLHTHPYTGDRITRLRRLISDSSARRG